MKKNYLAWDITYEDFFKLPRGRERLKFLMKFAVLAPSSHNSQPWKFQISENSVSIQIERERILRVSDPENRYLYIGLGCALENLLTAADYYGFTTDVEYLPPEESVTAAKIIFHESGDSKPNPEHLALAIATRRSNRTKFSEKIPSQAFLSQIKNILPDEVEVSVVLEKERREKIADILMDSRIKAFSNAPFRREIADYKRYNFTSSPLGMPAFTLGVSKPLSLIAPFVMRYINIMKLIRGSETAILKKYSPVFIFLNAKNHDRLGWLKTGQVLQKLLLEAEHAGIQASMSAVPLNVEPLQHLLDTQFRPQMFVRIGYAAATPGHAPRLPAEKTIEPIP